MEIGVTTRLLDVMVALARPYGGANKMRGSRNGEDEVGVATV